MNPPATIEFRVFSTFSQPEAASRHQALTIEFIDLLSAHFRETPIT